MHLPPLRPYARARSWRRLVFAVVLVLLLASYWMALRTLAGQAAEGGPSVTQPTSTLDRHTPRVD